MNQCDSPWPRLIRKLAVRLLFFVLALCVAGCDGSFTGGGIGGTGAPVAPALVVGVVDNFGSIVINDDRYVTDDAKLFTDGSPVTLTDLRIGMSITAKVDSDSMRVLELRYQPDFVGPVSSVDTDNRTLLIHGQRATWQDSTVFDALDPAELALGLELEVSGARGANEEIVATYIRKAATGQPYYAVGRVATGNDGSGINIADAVIDFQEAADQLGITPLQFETRYLVIGSIVRVAINNRAVADGVFNTQADNETVRLAITGAQPVVKPAYESGAPVQVRGIVSTTEHEDVLVVGDLEVLLGVGGVTEAQSASGAPIDFPEFPDSRTVLLNGTAQSANGKILVNVIRFLDEH